MTITAEPTKCKRNMSESRATDIATTARYSAYVLFKEKRYLFIILQQSRLQKTTVYLTLCTT